MLAEELVIVLASASCSGILPTEERVHTALTVGEKETLSDVIRQSVCCLLSYVLQLLLSPAIGLPLQGGFPSIDLI